MTDTIFALSSAPGRAAVAVIRVSGPMVTKALDDLCGGRPQPRHAALRKIMRPGSKDVLDEGLVIYFPAPNSASGEDMAELQIHGGRAVVLAVLDALSTLSDCRAAEPGEFARRGFDNGKIDLTMAEGIADLIDAETEAQRRQAQRQAGGALEALYTEWRDELIAAQALVEAAIDFSDEGDVGEKAYEGARSIITALAGNIAKHLQAARHGEIIRNGFRVVIAGPPNAGKSSLLNALARRDAAIVSDEAGTTRDAIEVHLDLGGLPVIVTDTAGIRETDGRIEREGIRRALDRAREADLILWLRDVSQPGRVQVPPEVESIRSLQVLTKTDLSEANIADLPPDADIGLSTKTGEGIDGLIDEIIAIAREEAPAGDDLVPTNTRHKALLLTSASHLEVFLTSDMVDLELRAEDLRLAANALGRLTGRIDVEDILDQIFSRFCVGK